jgi:cytochrome c553
VRRLVLFCLLLSAIAGSVVALRAGDDQERRPLPPSWPYGLPPVPEGEYPAQAPPILPPQKFVPPPPAATSPEQLRQAEGSEFKFTTQQIGYRHGPADWFPQDHPVMPEIVAKGKNPEVRACAMCHLPNGRGRPENAPVQGLSYEYIVQQLRDFQRGLRASAEPRKDNTSEMEQIARALTDDEIEASARYFSSMPWTRYIRVVETDTIPKMQLRGHIFWRAEGNETEPLGLRIVESPESTEQAQLRNPRSGWIAYVPQGAVKRGEALATTGGGRTVACSTCHGAGLKGVGPIPHLAGRSPSYLARQMYDFKLGTRRGTMSSLMSPVVANLTDADIVDLIAYVSSLEP